VESALRQKRNPHAQDACGNGCIKPRSFDCAARRSQTERKKKPGRPPETGGQAALTMTNR